MVGFDLGDGRCRRTVCIARPDAGCCCGELTPDSSYEYWTTDLKGHLSQIKRLLGRKFTDLELQSELCFLPFRVIEGPNGYPLIQCRCMGEDRAFSPIDILAMLISHLEAERPRNFCDFPVCLAVPIYFTEQQKKDMLEAAKVAGLTSPSLLDETTAMVLGYENSFNCARFLTSGFSDKATVAFIDIGYAGMQVCFAQFEVTYGPSSLYDKNICTKILYQAYVRSLGGRDFTKVLFRHFESAIKKEYNIDVYGSANACVCLSDACEVLKEKLKKCDEASFCIEKFSGSMDINGSIKRKDFEILSAPVLKRIEEVLQNALGDSQLDRSMIQSIETIGNECTMPAIVNILREVFGNQPTRRMRDKFVARQDSDELVARGCAIQSREKLWVGRRRTDLTGGVPTSDLALTESSSEIKKDDDSEWFLWRKAMNQGHVLTIFGDFLETNIQLIGRSKKTKDESYWLCKAHSSDQNIAFIDRAKKSNDKSYLFWKAQSLHKRDEGTSQTAENDQQQNQPNNSNEENPQLLLELSKPLNLIGQLMSQRDNGVKEMEELHQLADQQVLSCQSLGYFSEFSYLDLQNATNNFHESFKLGEGGFGIVYKGILHTTTVAIKILKEGSSQGAKEFTQEVVILSKVRHPNLVTLIGACVENRALIYEYLPNGSLEDRLRCVNNTPPLSWQARVRIAFEICTALSFLHCSKPHGIVHGDMKPDNILIDSNNISKISDFGLCRQLNLTESASVPFHLTDCPKGTLAYMDPEYFSTWMTTAQYDVYAFGIILLRLATCKDPRGIRHLVEEAVKKGRLETLIDPSAGSWPFKEARRMISVGLRCSDPKRKKRPNLSTQVWKEIKSMLEVASASGLL